MDLLKVSKFISMVLRHKPEEIGIKLDKYGWADVQELVEGVCRRYIDFTYADLEEIVRTDDKQRYSFSDDRTQIRANQGHSIKVDLELEPIEPPEYLYHGTGQKYIESIRESGLVPKSRQHVHLSFDEETATSVGERHGRPFIYRVRSGEMCRDGFIFYKSENGVWLTNEVPVKYLERKTTAICEACGKIDDIWDEELPANIFRSTPLRICYECARKMIKE